MLRDKFIHYFQQWRERQLPWRTLAGTAPAGRSPREKGMLLAAAVFLFCAVYYVLIWQPLSERIEQQETMLQQLVAMNALTEEHCAGYYCGAKIRHDNASTGIAGHQ
ncbi:type II secretion system protein GspM [Escherichia coli]|nr:type II secretion system protein GspM [Escherichia coli]